MMRLAPLTRLVLPSPFFSLTTPIIRTSRWISRKEFKQIAPRNVPDNLSNELFFDYSLSKINGGFQRVMQEVKKDLSKSIAKPTSAFLLYHMGLTGLYDSEIIFAIENQIMKYKGSYRPAQLAFGGLSGALRLKQQSPYLLDFFTEEFKACQDTMHDKDLVELVLSLSESHASREFKVEYFKTYLEKPVLAKWEKIQKTRRQLIDLMVSLSSIQYPDSKLTPLVAKALTKCRIYGLEPNVKLFESISSLLAQVEKQPIENRQLVQEALEEALVPFSSRLSSHQEFKWIYNVAEKRYATYSELKANRNGQSGLRTQDSNDPFIKEQTLSAYSDNKEGYDDIDYNFAQEREMAKINRETNDLFFGEFFHGTGLRSDGQLDEESQKIVNQAFKEGEGEEEEEEEVEWEDEDEEEEVESTEEKLSKQKAKEMSMKQKRKELNKKMKGKKKSKGKLMRDFNVNEVTDDRADESVD